jgi:hypothetical protein
VELGCIVAAWNIATKDKGLLSSLPRFSNAA